MRLSCLHYVLFLVFLIAPGKSFAQTVTPYLNCVRYDPSVNVLTAYFGYNSSFAVPQTIQIGPSNFFSPGVLSRGQPTIFYPGMHDRSFQTSFNVSPSQPQVTWFLEGLAIVAKLDQNFLCDPPKFRGNWDAATQYSFADVVQFNGSSWIEADFATAMIGIAPDASPEWKPLDATPTLTPIGRPGNPGIIQSTQTYTLPPNGSLTILDSRVVETSMIFAQFIGARKDRPPISVDAVSPGKFTVSSLSSGDFRYIIIN